MKKRLFCSILFLSFNALAFTQRLDWYHQIGGNAYKFVLDLQHDSLDNLYVFGTFRGSLDLDPGPGETILSSDATKDLFLQKLDTAGQLQWVRQIGGPNIDSTALIALDAAGNAYIFGTYHQTADFDPGPGELLLTALAPTEIFIEKLDAAGQIVWVKPLPIDIYVGGLAIDEQGDFALLCSFKGTVDLDPGPGYYPVSTTSTRTMVILNLDAGLNFRWAVAYPQRVYGVAIQTNREKEVYVMGEFSGTIDFDPGPDTVALGPSVSASNGDLFIEKLDTAGHLLWADHIPIQHTTYSVALEVDRQGNAFATGYFIGNGDFDPGPGTYPLSSALGQIDIFILKLRNDGLFAWARKLNGGSLETTVDMALDPEGNCYTTGYLTKAIDLDPGPGTVMFPSLYPTPSTYDAFVLRLDTAGQFNWARRFSGPGDDIGYDITVDRHQNVYAGGSFTKVLNFGEKKGEDFLIPGGKQDVFVVKLSQKLNYQGIVFHDQNGNLTQDSGEPGLPYVLLTAQNAGLTYSTNSLGQYWIFRDIAGDTLRPVLPRPYWTIEPAYVLPDSSHAFGSFAVTIPPNVRDAAVTAAISPGFRPGFSTKVLIQAINVGSVPLDSATLTLDSFNLAPALQLTFIQPTPNVQLPGHIAWRLDTLMPGETALYWLWLKTPDTTAINTLVDFPITLLQSGDADSTNNIARITARVRGAVDPNDKQVEPSILPVQQLDKARLTYVIRFQNTGNAAADFVIIRDTLPAGLDIASLQVLGASHPYSWRLRDQRILEVRFDPINLPDSTTNLEGSQGFVAFSIRPDRHLNIGDAVANRAGIYFDYNPPIMTNAAVSTVTFTSLVSSPPALPAFEVTLSPNPVAARAPFRIGLAEDKSIERITVETLEGAVLRTIRPAAGAAFTPVSGLEPGLYVVRVQVGGQAVAKLLLVQ